MRYCSKSEIIASKVIDILIAIILYLVFNFIGEIFFHRSYYGVYGLLVCGAINIILLTKTQTIGRNLLKINLFNIKTNELISNTLTMKKTIYDILCFISVIFFVVNILQIYKNKETNQTLVDQKLNIISVTVS